MKKKHGLKMHTLIVAALIMLCATTSCMSKKQLSEPFFCIQMTDPQFGFFTDNKDFVKETENFEKAIKAANRLKPAFVIITGDLINKTGDQAQIAEYKRILAMLDKSIPVYNLAGNHDVNNDPTVADMDFYNKEFGEDYYSFKHKGLYAIVLNSLYFKSPSAVQEKADAQDKWLRNELEKAKKSGNPNIVIFQHHSWFLNDPLEKNDYFTIDNDIRKIYLNLFEKAGVSHIFAGHYHRNAFGKSGNMEMVTTGPVGRPLGNDPSGIRIIRSDGKNITHEYYGLDAIPDRVVLEKN